MKGSARVPFIGFENLGLHAIVIAVGATLQFLVMADGHAAGPWVVPLIVYVFAAIQWVRFTSTRIGESRDPTYPRAEWTHEGVVIRWALSDQARSSRMELGFAGVIGFALLIASAPLGATSTPSYSVRYASIFWAILWSGMALVWLQAVWSALTSGGDVQLDVRRDTVEVVAGRETLTLPIAGLTITEAQRASRSRVGIGPGPPTAFGRTRSRPS